MQSYSAPAQKITIIPRTSGALGYTMQVERVDPVNKTATDDVQKRIIGCCYCVGLFREGTRTREG